MIIAILKAGALEGKIKLPRIAPEVKVPVTLPLTISWLQEAFTPDSVNKHPVFVFEYYRQISRHKHVYRLKEIL